MSYDNMPYKKPLRKKGVRESKCMHFLKLCWFEIHFEDIYENISRKEFFKNFEQIEKDKAIIEKIETLYGIDWTYYNEDGSLKLPDYDALRKNGTFKKNEWDTQYPIFKVDKLMSTEDTEREKYLRNLPNLNRQDYELLDRCYEKEKEYTATEKNGGKDMTYYRNKNNETKSHTDERLRKRVGFADTQRVEVNGDVTTHSQNTIDIDKDLLEGIYAIYNRRDKQSSNES